MLQTWGAPHIRDDVHTVLHPAANMMKLFRDHGATVETKTEPWERSKIEERLHRGSHSSVNEHVDFVRDEMADFAKKMFLGRAAVRRSEAPTKPTTFSPRMRSAEGASTATHR